MREANQRAKIFALRRHLVAPGGAAAVDEIRAQT